ncbi:O-acyltransferase like protein-like [Bacillus rossius redtenbacheri]|uniref:O-acyltransferase like protein-like n=1 Tax=Bacillus rossius redtenbacheri TaxID=93214 RepID=UPI002FDE6A45
MAGGDGGLALRLEVSRVHQVVRGLLALLCVRVAAGNGSHVVGLHELYSSRAPPTKGVAHLAALLDVYQPRSLRLPPGLGLDCSRDLDSFLVHLANSSEWAERMWDASGRYSSQLLWGNNFWLGSITQCQDLARLQYPPFQVHFFVTSLLINISVIPQARQVSLGVCLPSSCSASEVTSFLESSLPSGASVLRSRAVPDPDYSVWTQPALYLAGSIAAVATLLVLIASVVDVVTKRHKIAATTNKTTVQTGDTECNGNNLSYTSKGPDADDAMTNTPKENSTEPSKSIKLLLCFSAISNLKKLCNINSSEALACLHGFRVLSLVWVIAGHSCMFAYPFSDNKDFRRMVERDFLFQSISSGAFSVDTFFFISGILVAYVFRKAAVLPAASCFWGGVRRQAVHFAGVFSYRYCRLILPYVFVLVVNQVSALWLRHNSVFDSPTLDYYNCQHYWWRNLLFINTLFPVKDMCMIWSWYLANDMQFYTLAIILLMLSSRYLKVAAGSLMVLLVSSCVTTGFISLHSEHVPSIEEPLGQFDRLYDKPWTRLGPYVVGLLTGWLLHHLDCKLQLHKVITQLQHVLYYSADDVQVHFITLLKDYRTLAINDLYLLTLRKHFL